MNPNKTYYADDRLNNCCAYCGGFAETEDHVPSRCFLDKPYPQNMRVVPCCQKCNHDFSIDEEYVSCLIDCMKEKTTNTNLIRRKKTRKTLSHSFGLSERIKSQFRKFADIEICDIEKNRFELVMSKLAFGHLAHENSSINWDSEYKVDMWLLENMSNLLLNDFENPYSGDVVPEVGSNSLSRILVGLDDSAICCDWVMVQNGRYRYCVSPDSTKVKFVIAEYLAVEVSIMSHNV
jgi:hypothetical protein